MSRLKIEVMAEALMGKPERTGIKRALAHRRYEGYLAGIRAGLEMAAEIPKLGAVNAHLFSESPSMAASFKRENAFLAEQLDICAEAILALKTAPAEEEKT